MAERDLYNLLGVSKTASTAELKKAYRKLAKELHPDRNPGDTKIESRFKDVSYAYDVLSDPKKRALYDEFGEGGLREGFNVEAARQYKQWQSGGSGSPNWGSQFEEVFRGARGGHGGGQANAGGFSFNLEDLFGGFGGGGAGGGAGGGIGDMFGQAARTRGKPADVEASFSISFVDALRGGERDLHIADGRGGTRAIKARFPAGVRDGGKLRLRGQGTAVAGGGPAGDLVLLVRVEPHAVYRREGDDLHVDLPLTPAEAVRGAKVAVPTLDGEVQLKVPASSQSGQVLRVRGKGAPVPGKPDAHGDLYAHLLVMMPTQPDGATEDLADRLSEGMGDVRTKLRL